MKARTRKPRQKKITLTWYARTDRGWRHFPVIIERHHGVQQPRHGWVTDRGQLVEYPKGRYELRSYDAKGRKVYTPVEGCHPMVAMAALRNAQQTARAVGDGRNPLNVIRGSIDAYIADLTARRKPEMATKARHVLGEFADFANNPRKALDGIKGGSQKKTPPPLPVTTTRSITREHILAFHAVLRHRGASERTVADKHQRVKAWLRFCKVDTSFFPRTPTYEETKPTTYDPKQIEALRGAATAAGDLYMRIVIDLALKLGLREQEIMHAEYSDFNLHEQTFRVQGKVRKHWQFAVKDKAQRDVPVPVDLLQTILLWRHLRPDTVLIVGNSDDTPERHLLRKLKTLVRNAELGCSRCAGCLRQGHKRECEEFELHKFRRTCLTMWLRNGIDVATVQDWAGHSDLASTMRYIRSASAKEMQEKVNAIRW